LLYRNVKEKNNFIVNFFNTYVQRAFEKTFKHRRIAVVISIVILTLSLISIKFLGTEFLPQLNEGALWVEAKFPMSQSLNETVKMVKQLRMKLNEYQEVNGILSQTGRSNDGT